MEGSIVGDSSIVFGGIAVLVSAIIDSVTLLWITYRKRRDDQIREVKARADAHRRLWYVLGQINADEKREREEQSLAPKPHEPRRIIDMVVDNEWLQDYFRDNAALLDTELHDAYQDALGMHSLTRDTFREHEKWNEDPDI